MVFWQLTIGANDPGPLARFRAQRPERTGSTWGLGASVERRTRDDGPMAGPVTCIAHGARLAGAHSPPGQVPSLPLVTIISSWASVPGHM